MNILERIAAKTELKPAQIEKRLGFGNGTMGRWDKSSPSFDKVIAVADLIDVSVDYLAGRGIPHKEEIIITYGYSKKDGLINKLKTIDLTDEKIDLLNSIIDSWI